MKEQRWKKSKVPNLVKCGRTGRYFGRAKVAGKMQYESLKTFEYEVALRRLAKFQERMAKQRVAAKKAARVVSVAELSRQHTALSASDSNLKPKSLEAIQWSAKRLLETWPELETLKPSDLTFDMVKAYSEQLKSRPRASKSTVNKTLSALAQALDLARERGLSIENVARMKGLRVRGAEKKGHVPSRDELRRIVDYLKKRPGISAYGVQFIASTGCRIDEARRILFKHVDLARREMLIPGTKSEAAKRTIPISASLAPLLEAYRAEVIEVAGENGISELRVCPIDDLRRMLQQACKALRIPRFSNHELRDYFTTTCLEASIPVHTVAAWLGHSDGGALLLKKYAHVRDRHSFEMGQRLDF